MPIQKIKRGGETFYRWGDSGKEYRNRADAERQAAAAYASGYRKKESTQTKDRHAEAAGRKVTRDIEYDDMRSGTREPHRIETERLSGSSSAGPWLRRDSRTGRSRSSRTGR